MTSRLLKLLGISSLVFFTVLSNGITVAAKKNAPKSKELPKTVAKKSSKDKERLKDKDKAKAKAKEAKATAAKDNPTGKDNAKTITKDRKKGSNVAGVLYGSAGFAALVTMPFTTRSGKNCPPARGNPSPGAPKTNAPCP